MTFKLPARLKEVDVETYAMPCFTRLYDVQLPDLYPAAMLIEDVVFNLLEDIGS